MTASTDPLRERVLRYLLLQDRPMTLAEISMLTIEPTHRVVLALEDLRCAGRAHVSMDGYWFADQFTSLSPAGTQQSLPA